MRRVLLAAVLAMLAGQARAQIGNPAGWAPNTQMEQAGKPMAQQNNYQDYLFAQLAAAGGLAEVDLGKLAESKAANADVKQFAERMIDDHGKANDKLTSIAQKSRAPMSGKPDAEHSQARANLEKLNGGEFDRAYIAAQVTEHQKTAQLLAWEIGQGQNAEMQRFASETLPTVLEHLRQARDLAAQYPTAVADTRPKQGR
jgi:putative membrane protein